MALVRCSECGNMVSTNATACPHCGNPVKSAVFTPKKPTQKPIEYEYMSEVVIDEGMGMDFVMHKLKPILNEGWEVVSIEKIVRRKLGCNFLGHEVLLKRKKVIDTSHWKCKKCGAQNFVGDLFCKQCGEYK